MSDSDDHNFLFRILNKIFGEGIPADDNFGRNFSDKKSPRDEMLKQPEVSPSQSPSDGSYRPFILHDDKVSFLPSQNDQSSSEVFGHPFARGFMPFSPFFRSPHDEQHPHGGHFSFFGDFGFHDFGSLFAQMEEDTKRMFDAIENEGVPVLPQLPYKQPENGIAHPRRNFHSKIERYQFHSDAQGNTITTRVIRNDDEERTIVTKQYPDGRKEVTEKVTNLRDGSEHVMSDEASSRDDLINSLRTPRSIRGSPSIEGGDQLPRSSVGRWLYNWWKGGRQ